MAANWVNLVFPFINFVLLIGLWVYVVIKLSTKKEENSST
jgi:hypothetical protein